ncbi:MAG TPA: thioredoxin family protein [Thermoanaerobaculia bacterium]|nr:thioredoxin family protein [Thermoanaerobaculia bacterium]
MTKRILILVLAAFLLNVAELDASSFLTSLEAAKAEAKKKDQIIFVDLFADWCGWCHRMKREVFPSETFQNATKNMVLLRVDTEDRGEGTQLARAYKVRQLPTFLLIDADGLLAGSLYGYSPAEKFTKRLIAAYSDYEVFKETLSRESTLGSDYPKRLAIAEEFLRRGGHEQGEQRLTALVSEPKVPHEIRDLSFYHLAASQLARKEYAPARETLQKFFSVQTSGDSLERARLMMSQIYFEEGNYPKALAELKGFKQKFPASPLIEQVEAMLPQLESAVARKN